MADDPAPPVPSKRSGGGWGTIAVIVVLLAGTVAVVAINIRNFLAKREHKRDGWEVATYLAQADAEAKRWHADAQLVDLKAMYTDASGRAQLANRNGDLRFYYQTLSVTPDEPAQLGAAAPKTKPKAQYCQLAEYIQNQRTTLSSGLRDGGCDGKPLGPLHCSVVQIWERAIAKGAPATALADINMDVDNGARDWRFEIIDHQSTGDKTVFEQHFADDCTPAAEK